MTRARETVAEGPQAVGAEVEAASQPLLANEEGASHQRNWLRLMAGLPWGEPPPVRRSPTVGAARCSFDAVHGGHADLKTILAERVVTTAHMELRGDGEHRLLLVGPPGNSRLLMVLGEIDKVGVWSWHGTSPTAWLLELPGSTADRPLLPYPTSAMGFVATANSLGPIAAQLLDRCEVVEVAGLTVAERVQVADSPVAAAAGRLRPPREAEPLSPDALELVVSGLCGPRDEAGLRAVEIRLEALQHHAIARGAPDPAGVDHCGVRGRNGWERGPLAGWWWLSDRCAQPPSVGEGDTWAVSHQMVLIFEVAIGGTKPQAAGWATASIYRKGERPGPPV